MTPQIQKRVWCLTNTPSPYQVEFFRALHSSGRVVLDVRFMHSGYRGAEPLGKGDAGFAWKAMSGGSSSWADALRIHGAALREVKQGAHDVCVLSGQYTSPTFMLCAWRLARMGRKPILWLERPCTSDWPVGGGNRWRRFIRERYLARLLRGAGAVFCIGTVAVEEYGARGVAADRLFMVPYACDSRRFQDVDEAAIAAVRHRWAGDNGFLFLFSGALDLRKGVDTLIDAFNSLAHECPDVALLILGDGPLRQSLEARVHPDVRQRVYFAGKVEQGALPAHFRAADAFVFPSRYDGWGVVLNEACSAGLPIIATRQTGAARDLVEEGKNGFVVERNDSAALYERMKLLVNDRGRAREMGLRSQELIKRFDLDAAVTRFCDGLDRALALNRGSSGSNANTGTCGEEQRMNANARE